jgi:hypothetical protein
MTMKIEYRWSWQTNELEVLCRFDLEEIIRRARDEIATGAAVGAETSGPGPRTVTRPGTRLGHSCPLPPDYRNRKSLWTCEDCGRIWFPSLYGWVEIVGTSRSEVDR